MSLVFEIGDIPEEGMPVDVKVGAAYFNRGKLDGTLSQDVLIQGTLSKWEPDVFLSGKITAEWSGKCSRCLEPVKIHIKTDISVKFAPQSESPEAGSDTELSESDIDVEYYTENKIDLSQPIYDQIMLSVPLADLCDENCLGLCSQCGANLNKGPCVCGDSATVDPRLAILKSLKNKLE